MAPLHSSPQLNLSQPRVHCGLGVAGATRSSGGMGQDTTVPKTSPNPSSTSRGVGRGETCLRLILGEMEAAQLLHPHVGVPQLCHVVAQGQDTVGTMKNSHITPECPPVSSPASQSEQALCLHPKPCPVSPAAADGQDNSSPSPPQQGHSHPRCGGTAPLTPLYQTGTGWPGWAFSSRGLLDRGS